MNLQGQFNRTYLNYLASVILPAIATALVIPLIKNLMGDALYGRFSLLFNATMISSIALTGWLTQSINRFYPSESNKRQLLKKVVSYVFFMLLIVVLPFFFFANKIGNDYTLSMLMSVSFVCISIQLILFSIAQASFLSRNILFAESIRTISYFLFMALLLIFIPTEGVNVMFIAVIFAYLLAIFFLVTIIRKHFNNQGGEDKEIQQRPQLKKFILYGTPLSLWFVFSNLNTYIDKLFLVRYFNESIQGNYQALFDFISRGITLLVSPVLLTLMPLLSKEYEIKKERQVRVFLKKILGYMLLGWLIALLCYQTFAAKFLFLILHIPQNEDFHKCGLLIISTVFIWQLAMVVHKLLELKLKTEKMLFFVIISFLSQCAFYLSMKECSSILIFPFGCLLSSLVYLILVSIPLFLSKRNAHPKTS